jgi:two-component system chemotaxis response regulator CheB
LDKLKVLLVDGSVIARMAILEAVNSTEYGIIERAASNGGIALEWLKQCNIDIVLIDVMIIKNEGIDILKMIKSNYPKIEIIIMSNDHPESPAISLESLKAGAMDFIQKPPEGGYEIYRSELKAQANTLFSQIIRKKSNDFFESAILSGYKEPSLKNEDKNSREREIHGSIDLILIASSTGGPVALDTIFSAFPSGIYKPVLIVQHMPPEFTNLMANTMERKYHLNIREAKDRETLKGGQIIVAPGGRHMTVETSGGVGSIIRLLDTENVNGVKPSADVLFKSVASSFKGKNILAVVLTGMGNDGTKGILELKRNCNCYCITQSEKTCVVYGMPKCVFEAGLSDEVADLKDIAYRIYKIAAE